MDYKNLMLARIEVSILNAIEYYKQNGFSALFRLLFNKLGFVHFSHSRIILKLDMRNIQDNDNDQLIFHLATIDDIQDDKEFDIGFFNKRKTIYRLRKGHRLFIVKENKKIVFAIWIEQKNVSFGGLDDLPLNLPKGMAYSAAVYTSPEFRNRGIYTKAKVQLYPYLKREGINCLITTIHPENILSIRIHRKFGWKEYQTINYKRYWHIRFFKVTDANSNKSKKFITLFKSPKGIWKTFF